MTEEARRCEECGLRKLDVQTVIDPYMEDVYDEKCWITACEDCLQNRRDSI